MLIHASCVAINNQAVLLAGISGSGKSDLALRLIDGGNVLVADDQTHLHAENDQLIASPPSTIAGLLEIHHIGLMRLPFLAQAPVALYVELTDLNAQFERLPETEYVFLLDQRVRRLRLPAFAASTPAKIRAVLNYPLETDGRNTATTAR